MLPSKISRPSRLLVDERKDLTILRSPSFILAIAQQAATGIEFFDSAGC
jgi:hypothetical protein